VIEFVISVGLSGLVRQRGQVVEATPNGSGPAGPVTKPLGWVERGEKSCGHHVAAVCQTNRETANPDSNQTYSWASTASISVGPGNRQQRVTPGDDWPPAVPVSPARPILHARAVLLPLARHHDVPSLSSPQQQRTIVVAGPGADGGWKRGGRYLPRH